MSDKDGKMITPLSLNIIWKSSIILCRFSFISAYLQLSALKYSDTTLSDFKTEVIIYCYGYYRFKIN